MEYRGYKVTQSSNNHIIISKDGREVSHINCSAQMCDEDLRKTVDFILEMREQTKAVYLHNDIPNNI